MNLPGKITMILSKFNDPDCVVTAEKEIKALIVNEIDDGEKLNILINCLSEDKDVSNFTNKKTKYNQLKLFISIAEIFQHQILEFLPKIFSKLNKKIKDGDLDVAEIISETYGGIIEFAFKGAQQEDALIIFDECLNGLFNLSEKGMKNIQVLAAQSITKIIQSCQIPILNERFQQIYDNLIKVLSMQSCKATFNFLECILSLILSIQQKVDLISTSLPDILDKHIDDKDPKTRKFCIEIFYTLVAIDHENMLPFHERIYNHLQKLKRDPNKNVRESAMDCLKVINPPEKKQSKKERIQSQRVVQKIEKKEKKRPVSKKSVVVNQKMNLEHIKPQIDKKKINKNFLKQNSENIEILVKENSQQNKIDYDQFYDQNTEKLLQFQEKNIKEKPKNQTKNFGTIPNFQETNYQSPFDQTNQIGANFVVMTEKQQQLLQKRQLENNQSFEVIQENEEQIPNNNIKNRQTPIRKSQNNPGQEFQNNKNFNHDNKSCQEETMTLKKYIKVLNRKLKDSSHQIKNLENQNVYLSQKMTDMEVEFKQIKQIILTQQNAPKNSFENQIQQNQQSFYKNSQQQEQNINNKWLMKNSKFNQNINDALMNILASSNSYQKQQDLLKFLRSSQNMREFAEIDDSIRFKLLKEILQQITQNINEDILILEYCLKWIQIFLDHGEPKQIEILKQLHSVLYLSQNAIFEQQISNFAKKLMNHQHILNNMSNSKSNPIRQFQSNQIENHHFSEDEEEDEEEEFDYEEKQKIYKEEETSVKEEEIYQQLNQQIKFNKIK